jgi:hypothetical protein
MTLVIQDGGLTNKLEGLRTKWNAAAVKMHLYSNNFTPLVTSVLGDFTECTFAGYAAQDIITWGAAAVAAHIGKITAAPNVFTRSTTGAAQNVYGYYVTDAANAVLEWGELDPAGPRVVTSAGDSVTVTAVMQDQNA